MSFEQKADEAKMLHQSGDEHEITSTDFEAAGSEDAESMVVDLDDDGYQDLHRADIEDIQPKVGGDVSGDFLEAGTSYQDEVLHVEFNLELDDNSPDVHGGEVDTAQPDIERDIAEDLLGIGASFPDDALHIDPALEVE